MVIHTKFETNRFISVCTGLMLKVDFINAPKYSSLPCILIVRSTVSMSFNKQKGCDSILNFRNTDREICGKTSAPVFDLSQD